jgi:hypothetical protein
MFKVKRDSWHYRWLVYYSLILDSTSRGSRYWPDLKNFNDAEKTYRDRRFPPTDFCAYWRAVLVWPALRLGINLVAWSLPFIVMYFAGLSGAVGFGIVFGFIAAFAVAIALLGFAGLGLGKVRDWFWKKADEAKGDEFLAHVYESYKGKFCSKVEYEEKAQ